VAFFCRAAEDQFLDLVRQDAAQMMRLRHPGVVRVIQALDESKAAMAMVTEPIFASAANVLGRHDNVAKVPTELKDLVRCFIHASTFARLVGIHAHLEFLLRCPHFVDAGVRSARGQAWLVAAG
jgi:hypothetical protein